VLKTVFFVAGAGTSTCAHCLIKYVSSWAGDPITPTGPGARGNDVDSRLGPMRSPGQALDGVFFSFCLTSLK
jgi:hypothetical protein